VVLSAPVTARLQENVEIVLAAYARFNAGERTPEGLGIWDEGGEYHPAREDPDFAVHRGIDALRRHYASWVDAYPDLRLEPVEARERGDIVFLWVRASGRARASGVPLGMQLAHVITMRDSKVTRLQVYTDRVEALHAAGLRNTRAES
jgi:ketosteroid isomerase-like protein